jgi:hypothetical protein
MSRCFVVDSPFGVDNTALEFNYYHKIPELLAGANWLFGAHPDLYLFGSLVEACLYLPKTRGAGAIHVMGVTP